MEGISGNYSLGSGELRAFTSATNAASISLNMSGESPEEDTTFSFRLKASNVAGSSSGTLPAVGDFADMQAMMAAGFGVTGTMNYGASEFSFDVEEEGESVSARGTGATGGLDFSMTNDGLSYRTRATGLDM